MNLLHITLFKLKFKIDVKIKFKIFLLVNETSALRKKCFDYTNKTYLYGRKGILLIFVKTNRIFFCYYDNTRYFITSNV